MQIRSIYNAEPNLKGKETMNLKRPIKNVMIFGDSYSTFEGYIPKGYGIYYTNAGHEKTDVRHVEETWWHRLCKDMDLNLVLNNSWSGSTVGYLGYNDTDCSKTSSFIYRLDRLVEEGFFKENDIDTVFVFGGTTDRWSGNQTGDVMLSDWTREDLYLVSPAICYFVHRLTEVLPDANIVCIVNTDLRPEIGEATRAACEAFGASCLTLEYLNKKCGHPTIRGMADIEEQLLAFLK